MKKKSLLLTSLATLGLTAATMAQNVPNYVPTNGLVGWWPFNGNANDESGNGNNGTVNGATLTTDRFGSMNKAYSFNISTISINNSNIAAFGLSSFSASAWFKTSMTDVGNIIRYDDCYQGALWGIRIGRDNQDFNSPGIVQGLEAPTSRDANIVSSSQTFNDNSWHNVVYVRDVSAMNNRIYIDGNFIAQISFLSVNDINITGSPLLFGACGSWAEFFTGLIDDIGIWNRALTQQEITALFNSQSCTATITTAGPTTFCQGGSVVLNANTGSGLTYQWRNNGNNISGATAASYTANTGGSYTVVVTDGNGCSATSSATSVSVNPLPNAAINASGSTTFCQGGSVVLNANTGAGLTYQWRNNGNNISGATAANYTANTTGSYSVVVTNGNGCAATSTATTVTVNPTPTVSISGLNSFTNINANSASIIGNPTGGLFTGLGMSGSLFNPQSAGLGSATITYSFTNVNGCSNNAVQTTIVYDTLGIVCTSYDTITTSVFDTTFVTQTFYDTVQVNVYDTLLTTVTDTLVINTLITGINPPNNLNTLKVFPNPASSHITIDYGNFNTMSGYTLTIINTVGQTVFTTPINQQSSYIDLSTWTGNGIYFVQLIDPQNNTIETRKIVIQ